MKSTAAAFLIAFVIAAVLTPVVGRLALRAGATNEPGGRHIHSGRIPRLGGVAVAAAFFVPLVVLLVLDSTLAHRFFEEPSRIVGLGVGAAMMLALGAVDDLRGVRPAHKLLVQGGAAIVAWSNGYDISSVALPFIGRVDLGIFGIVVTTLWFVGLINALNLIDGLDGLAAGIAFFACVTNLLIGFMNESLMVILLSSSLAGALLGFLVHNFNPATIFMGDSGSMFLGFVLAATSMLGSTIKSSTTVTIVVPMIALGIPITDTVWAFARRLTQRRPLFGADRGHIHHRLLDLGLSQRNAVVVLYAASFLLAGIATAVALGQSVAAGGALLIMMLMLVGFVGTARAFALRGLPDFSAGEPLADGIRARTPKLMRALDAAADIVDVRRALETFAQGLGVQACLELPDDGGEDPGRYAPSGFRIAKPAAAHTVFPLDSAHGSAHLCFITAPRSCGPRSSVLLRLIADIVDEAIARTSVASPTEPRTAPMRSGRVADEHDADSLGPDVTAGMQLRR